MQLDKHIRQNQNIIQDYSKPGSTSRYNMNPRTILKVTRLPQNNSITNNYPIKN